MLANGLGSQSRGPVTIATSESNARDRIRRQRIEAGYRYTGEGRLKALYPDCEVEILGMTTRGDQILDRTLSKVGGKGLFVKELEQALYDGRADLAAAENEYFHGN